MNFYLLGILLAACLPLLFVHSCNENVCGSVVTKCLLIEACGCTLKNCTCCKDCFLCLGKIFDECCSCIELCPPSNNTYTNLSKSSYIEELSEKVPSLFEALTELPDPVDRWTTLKFPVEVDSSLFAPKVDVPFHVQTSEESVPNNLHFEAVNCTVAYMANCVSLDKCKSSCQSMGATSVRWFHDGCCECVGNTCINFGKNESLCLKCGPGKENIEERRQMLELLAEEEWDYGEGDEYLYE